MPENDVTKPFRNFPRGSSNKLKLDARSRFILLFALFNTMFCLLVWLSLRNMELGRENRQLESTLAIIKTEINKPKQEQMVVEYATSTHTAEIQIPQPQPPSVVSPTAYPTYTSYPTYTFVPPDTPVPPPPTDTPILLTPTPLPPTPTSTPVPPIPPTPTPLPPAPTDTPVPPTPTDTPTPTPTPTNTDTPTPVSPTPTFTPTVSPTTPAPVVLRVSPNQGETGSGVPILALSGQYFQLGATAQITNGINSVNLAPSTVVSSTLITGTLDLSAAAGGPWDVMVTNPDLQRGIATNTFTVTIPITYSYGITATCSPRVTNCLNIIGPPHNDVAEILEGGVITLDLGVGNGIMNGRGYDMVFYEFDNSGTTFLDWIIIQLSEDLSSWQTVFNWGDGYQPPPGCTDSPLVACDSSSEVVPYSNDANGEQDNEAITTTLLYNGPGIRIDIDFLDGPPTALYRYVRLSSPDNGSGNDAAQVDSIERLH